MSEKVSTYQGRDFISRKANYLYRNSIEQRNSFSETTMRIERDRKIRKSNNDKVMKFHNLGRMINLKNEKEDQTSNYQISSALRLASSFANNLTVSLPTNSLTSSTNSIRSSYSTTTFSPLSNKSPSSTSLIDSQTLSIASASSATTLPTNYLSLQNENNYCLINGKQLKKSKKRNKRIRTLSTCLRTRSTSISGICDSFKKINSTETATLSLALQTFSFDHDLLSQMNNEQTTGVSEVKSDDVKMKTNEGDGLLIEKCNVGRESDHIESVKKDTRGESADSSCSDDVKSREINSDKGSSQSNSVHLMERTEDRKNKNSNDNKIRDLKGSLNNKSKSANDLNDSSIVPKQRSIYLPVNLKKRSNSVNQLLCFKFKPSELNNSNKSETSIEYNSLTKLTNHQKSNTSGTLCLLKKLAKGFNTNLTKKDRIRESLNSQSTNCIEQLLLHEQCKLNKQNILPIHSLVGGLKNEIKMKSKRTDSDYNLTKSMKTVDHKDLTLIQILALKTIRSKLKPHHGKLSHTLFNSDLNNSNEHSIDNQQTDNLSDKMVLPELSSNPLCAENALINFIDSKFSNKSSDHHNTFIINNNDFTSDENISKNNQDLYRQKFNQVHIESKEKDKIHQCNSSLSTKSDLTTDKKKWIQLAGHEKSFFFSARKPGIILKRKEHNESSAYTKLNEANDQIIEFIPKFYSIIETNDGQFIELQDLLTLFDNKCNIIDLKMGCRTFLENDVSNISLRPDLYEKLIKIDLSAATQEEQEKKAITKLRYMTFRENLSSSSTLGFRIEGFRCKCNGMIKDFKYLRKEDDVKKVLKIFLPMDKDLRFQLLKRLKLLKLRFEQSDFFKNHEVVGSSLLIIHDDHKIGVWMIDFGRTVELPKGVKINHETKWNLGNHEDGYLTGLNNLIRIIKEIG